MVPISPDMPAYVHIKRVLKNRIEDGDLPEGARVPSEMDLARQYNVSRNPTRQALRDLELDGYIIRSPGRGSFVAPLSRRKKPLHMGSWRTLAISCPVLECHFTRQVVQGFIDQAVKKSFHTMVYFHHFSDESEFDFLADMRNSGIDGIAFWLQHACDSTLELLGKFQKVSFPFVLIDRYVHGLDADYVVTDNEDLGYQLTKVMLDRGHKAVGFITTPLNNTTIEDRLAGHKRALEEAGLPYVPQLTGFVSSDDEPLSAIVQRILAFQQRPTGFVCTNDGVASKLLDELEELGYVVPRDVEIATVDDNEFAQVLDYPIITASQAGYLMGCRSADLLIARTENPNRPSEGQSLKAEFHVPESMGTERCECIA